LIVWQVLVPGKNNTCSKWWVNIKYVLILKFEEKNGDGIATALNGGKHEKHAWDILCCDNRQPVAWCVTLSLRG
jgi:hypothetical protein